MPTIRVTSRLVFLDVTVVDKKGRPVTSGLTKDDFTITENRQPQTIFSFEAPDVHTLKGRSDEESANGEAPVTIIVLDELDSSFTDFGYIRYEVKRYLDSQPSRLRSRTEMMVVGNESLELVQGWTRSREDLLDTLQHLPAVLPYKQMNGSFWAERFTQSMGALQEIALENQGVPGRKNIIWMGHGGPGINTAAWPGGIQEKLLAYVHATTNLLVDARATLFVIYPGLAVNGGVGGISEMEAAVDLGDDDPFAGDVNFGVFVDETGGKLFYNRNDLDGLMREAERLGSEYYTLTYQPHNSDDNGRFERTGSRCGIRTCGQ
ncbi:MAG TPA: VWA domain-containing protein [Acidobacteriaceae bacterium]|nr:VWA domain-containing protein [Acidobacteriaceae bacterium]